ncbi:type IV pilus modification PilV family protein [Thomasclavelia sp.]
MKTKIHSFSFLLELIIVIFFFTASATVCVSFIIQAKNRQVQATEIQNSLIEAQNIIETMQAYPSNDLKSLLGAKKIDNDTYQIDDLTIKLINEDIIKGSIQIKNKDKIIVELPFILGGDESE